MRTRSSASAAAVSSGSSSVRTEIPAAIVIATLVLCPSPHGTARTTERAVRTHGITPGIANMIAVIPRTAMTNSAVGGIRNSVAGGGAVTTTVNHAMAHSGIAHLRANTNSILYLLLFSESVDQISTGCLTVSATRDVQLAIARSSSRDWRSSRHLEPASWE